MAIQKKVEKKNPPLPEVIPAGYEKYVTFDPKESDELATIANSEGDQKEPRVKHLGYKVLEDGRHERSFLKKIIKKGAFVALIISLLCGSNAFATRENAAFDDNDWQDRQVNENLTEIFARTRGGAEIHPVHYIYAAEIITLASGDLYLITGDTVISSIAAASTYAGRTVKLARPQGSTTGVTIVDGQNLLLTGTRTLKSGDSITLTTFDDSYWYQVATGDN